MTAEFERRRLGRLLDKADGKLTVGEALKLATIYYEDNPEIGQAIVILIDEENEPVLVHSESTAPELVYILEKAKLALYFGNDDEEEGE